MLKIKEEDVKAAHNKGCSDVRKTLEILFPKVFNEKFPRLGRGSSGSLYLLYNSTSGICIKDSGSGGYEFGELVKVYDSSEFKPVKGIEETY
jgi:hypothetical protein